MTPSFILTLVLMVSTTSQNRAMTTVTAEYANKAACERALTEHVDRVTKLTVGERYPERYVGVLISSCTSKS
jgi:hypothetical protein